MLFLAVFCGFLAEYQLEHKIEKQREKKFIISFIEDLKADTAFISQYFNFGMQKINMNDSLIWYLNSPNPNQYGHRIYYWGRQLTRTFNFFPTDGTMKQLKFSGGLRLISNEHAVDSIMSYDRSVEQILLTQQRQENELNEIRPMMGQLLNPNILQTMLQGDSILPPVGNPSLRTLNKEFLMDFIYAIHQLNGSVHVNSTRLQRLKDKATNIMEFLKKEYHLK